MNRRLNEEIGLRAPGIPDSSVFSVCSVGNISCPFVCLVGNLTAKLKSAVRLRILRILRETNGLKAVFGVNYTLSPGFLTTDFTDVHGSIIGILSHSRVEGVFRGKRSQERRGMASRDPSSTRLPAVAGGYGGQDSGGMRVGPTRTARDTRGRRAC